MKPKHQRLVFIGVSVVLLCAGVLVTLQAFRDNLVFFYSPSDLQEKPVAPGKMIRIGGLVGTVKHLDADAIEFDVTDGKAKVMVDYRGMLPNLFREGQGVVAEGTYEDGHVHAKTILAKHDERYMPRDVVDALKRSGRWKEGEK